MSAFVGTMREVVDELTDARNRLLGSVAVLSQADADFSPSPDRWSIGEILHHLGLVEASITRVLGRLAAKAEETGVSADPGEAAAGIIMHSVDQFNMETVVDRISAPASVVPGKGMPARELVESLAGTRAALMAALEKCSRFDLTKVQFPHPIFGRLDGYQWALHVAKHDERHRRQIEKMKSLRAGTSP